MLENLFALREKSWERVGASTRREERTGAGEEGVGTTSCLLRLR